MKENKIQILLLQETRGKHNSREARKTYTWYFSSENPTNPQFTTGVGIVIENRLAHHINKIIPYTDRLMMIQIEHTTPITIINTYCPQASRPSEEKEINYDAIEKLMKEHRNKGPVLVGGDFNARLQKPTDEEEKTIIGNHTFQNHTENTDDMPEDMQENRQLLMQLCKNNDLVVLNTSYRKQENKLATWRKIGAERTDNPTRENHEQIDYWLAGRRWRNMIKDAEADHKANIDSDHYPVKIRCRFALKFIPKPQHPTPKPQFTKCDENTARELNEQLKTELEQIRSMPQQLQLKRARETLQSLTEKLPKKPRKHKDTHYTRQTEELLNERKTALLEGNIDKFAELTKLFRKNKKKYKKQYVLRSITEDMDPRDKWMGIKKPQEGLQTAAIS